MPFAVKYQEPNEVAESENDYSVYSTAEDASINTAFQTNVSDYLNALHNVSYYLPNDETLHNEFCEDLHNILQKYIPLQQGQGVTLEEDETPNEEA